MGMSRHGAEDFFKVKKFKMIEYYDDDLLHCDGEQWREVF